MNVYESHEWGVENVPGDFSVLVKSVTGPEMIKHKALPIYGFQFHPENFADELNGDEIFSSVVSASAKNLDLV